ncbi:MAG: CorA family divalent cation transporter [Candidatus Paceibacterota bacterium]|jgi:Mg2+ and Co2+ transporter CorA
MIKKLKYQNIAWIDVTGTTRDEAFDLSQQYSLHAVTTEELWHPIGRSKIDWYEGYLSLTLRFPTPDHQDGEINFILGQNWLITTHSEPVQALSEFSQILENKTDHQKEKEFHAGHLFYYIIRNLYAPLENELDNLNRQLKRSEEKIFSGFEAEMVRDLSQINRRLLDIKWDLKFHREVLRSLALVTKDFYGEKFDHYAQAINNEYERISELVKTNREIFVELQSTNESLLTIKNGQTMRTLTALAFVFMPATLVSFIFGMSGSEKIVQSETGWYGVLILMISVATAMAIFAKYKKWI